MFRHILIAALWAVGLMFILFLGGSLLPPLVWIVALYPGMLVAQALFSVLPVSIMKMLMGGLGVDEAPALYASLSVVCAFLFWWLCAFTGVKVWAHLLKNKGAGRVTAAAGRFR